MCSFIDDINIEGFKDFMPVDVAGSMSESSAVFHSAFFVSAIFRSAPLFCKALLDFARAQLFHRSQAL